MTSAEFVKKVSLILAQTFSDLNKICNDTLTISNKLPEPLIQKFSSKSSSQLADEPSLPKSSQQPIKEPNKSEKKKRKRKQNIVGKPKPPPNAFVLYLQEKKFQIQGQHEGISIAGATSIASQQWKKMTPEDKEPYRLKYQQNRSKYEKEKISFYKEHPEHDPEKKNKASGRKGKEIDEQPSPSKKDKIKEKKKNKENRLKIEKSKLREAEEKEDDNFNPGDSENDNDQSL